MGFHDNNKENGCIYEITAYSIPPYPPCSYNAEYSNLYNIILLQLHLPYHDRKVSQMQEATKSISKIKNFPGVHAPTLPTVLLWVHLLRIKNPPTPGSGYGPAHVRGIGLPEVLFLVRERYFAHQCARQLKLHALSPPPFYHALLIAGIG